MESNNPTQETTPEQYPQQPVTEQSIKQKGFLLPVMGVVFLIVVVGAGAYFLGTTKSSTLPTTENAIPTSSLQSSPTANVISPTANVPSTIDQTANWKTYTNEKAGISFKYPDGLNSECCNISGPMIGSPEQVTVLADKKTGLEGTDKPFDGIAVYIVSKQKSFNEFIEEEKAAQLNAKQGFGGNNTPGTQTTFAIDNKQGVVLKGFSWDSNVRYYVPLSNNALVLVLSKSEQSPGSFDETFNTILSTFKFTR